MYHIGESMLATNLINNGFYKPLQREDQTTDSSQLNNILLNLLINSPAIREIENMVDSHFWAIHGDTSSIEQIERLFSELIQRNADILSKFPKTSQEKAKDIFNAYREAYFITVKENKTFQCAFEKQQRLFSALFPVSQLENAICSIVLTRIKIFHSIVPGLALEKIFSLCPYSLKLHEFPEDFSTAKIDISNLLMFYRNHFAKF